MNYTIEEKLKEIPIACVREKALESWGKLNDEQKSRNEADFINSLGRLSDAVEILHEFDIRNDIFWMNYSEYLEHGDVDELPISSYAALWNFQCETVFRTTDSKAQLLKLVEEIKEVEQELSAPTVDEDKLALEITDCIIVLCTLAEKNGIHTEDIILEHLPNKIFKNVNRNWVKLEDGTFKHVKE